MADSNIDQALISVLWLLDVWVVLLCGSKDVSYLFFKKIHEETFSDELISWSLTMA